VYKGGRWWQRRSGEHGLYEVLCVAIDKTTYEEGHREYRDREMVVYRPDVGGDGTVCKEINEFLRLFEPIPWE
jgi:hypothetical protein